MGLIIRSSDIHAAGCYTTAPIAMGTRVVDYTGPVVTKAEGDARYEGRPFTYLFGLDDEGLCIDGHGMAAFINHSCDPNCESDGEGNKIWIVAVRDIAAGEELTYDYCLWDGDLDDPAPCSCGAKNCRGSMYTEEELERQEKERAKRAAQKPQVTPTRPAESVSRPLVEAR